MARIPATERRAQLVEAAIDVMLADGVDAASTHRVAARAGVSQGIVHYVFEDKDALVAAVIEEVARRVREARSAAGEEAPVGDLLRAFWEFVEQTPGLQLLQYELTIHAVRDPEKSWLARRQYGEYLDIIESAIAAPGLDAPTRRRRARLLLATIDGLILQWLVFRDQEAATRAVDDLADLTDLAEAAVRRG